MEIFFFGKPYDALKAGAELKAMGFRDNRERHIAPDSRYELGDFFLAVNMTDSHSPESRTQIQGHYLADIWKALMGSREICHQDVRGYDPAKVYKTTDWSRAKSSERYVMLERLAGIFKPTAILDSAGRHIFPDLTGKK